MSKWVEVPVTITKVYAVEIESHETIEDAKQYAIDDCMGEDVEVGDCMVGNSEIMNESIKRHADEVLKL